MLGDASVTATIAVKDLEKAKQFYSDTLGLKWGGDVMGGTVYGEGANRLFLYESSFAGTNQATYAAWTVSDVAAAAEALKAKGVTFEQYDFPGGTREGDVHIIDDLHSAWFKDPDGNILAISNN